MCHSASFCLFVCHQLPWHMFCHRKSCRVDWCQGTQGDPRLGHTKLGHCDLVSGFYGPKFRFYMTLHSYGESFGVVSTGCYIQGQVSQHLYHTYHGPFQTYHPFDLDPFLKVMVGTLKMGTNLYLQQYHFSSTCLNNDFDRSFKLQKNQVTVTSSKIKIFHIYAPLKIHQINIVWAVVP